MTKLLFLLAATSLTLAGCGKPANPNTDTNTGTAETNTGMAEMNSGMAAGTATPPAAAAAPAVSAQSYVADAAAGDQFEIQTSELVLKQTKNNAVRAFAQQMVSDHTASTGRLLTLAKAASLTVPGSGLKAAQQNNIMALRDAGANMDQVYINQQRAAHAEAIALHQSAASNVDMPGPLTEFANNVLPVVQAHARMLDDMKATSSRR